MVERDRMRIEYLETKIWRNDTTCVNMIRLRRDSFFRFCELFRNRGLLEDTIHMCVEEQVAMFLNTVGHNLRNRLVGTNFDRSRETVSRYFKKVLHAVGELRDELIRPPSLDTPTKIAGNPRWDPYFKEVRGWVNGGAGACGPRERLRTSVRGKGIGTGNPRGERVSAGAGDPHGADAVAAALSICLDHEESSTRALSSSVSVKSQIGAVTNRQMF